MSENIQSISQGTYTIGQTSATNFVAGPGIKIDEPSAGTVRIGNDETVLWSGALNTTGGSYQMTDSIQNFNKIKVYGKWNGNYAVSRGESIQEFSIDDAGQAQLQYYPVFSNILSNVATQNIVSMYFYSDKTFNLGAGTKFVNGTATTGISTYDFNVTKVIGINRKEV